MNLENIEKEKFIRQGFFKKLDKAEKENYIKRIDDMSNFVKQLIDAVIKECKENEQYQEIIDSKELRIFMIKLYELEKYINIQEWKNFVVDIFFENDDLQLDEVSIIHLVDKLFDSSREKMDLFDVINNGDIEKLKKLIQEGVDINAKNKFNWAPLHIALKKNNIKIVEVLLENGADINARNINFDTPLDISLDADDIDVAKILIENGANINVKNKEGDNWLHKACKDYERFRKEKDLNLIDFLIENGIDINSKGKLEYTPYSTPICQDNNL